MLVYWEYLQVPVQRRCNSYKSWISFHDGTMAVSMTSPCLCCKIWITFVTNACLTLRCLCHRQPGTTWDHLWWEQYYEAGLGIIMKNYSQWYIIYKRRWSWCLTFSCHLTASKKTQNYLTIYNQTILQDEYHMQEILYLEPLKEPLWCANHRHQVQ